MIRVTSVGQVFNALQGDVPPPSLDAELKHVCRGHFRRIDRFIQLALLGSGRCAVGRTLAPDCGLYLGSGLGPMSGIIATQQQLVRDHELPRPFDFINTLGNSAGYYVARNLGLTGQNVFISRRGTSLQALLAAALTDLNVGLVRQALVGVVEEATHPLAEHCRRQGLAADTTVAEGSHWLLLETDADRGPGLVLQHHASAVGLEAALKRLSAERMPSQPTEPFHDSWCGAWLTGRLSAGAGSLLLLEGDPVRGWDLFHFGA
jgi:hypothetical protein